MSMSFVLPLFLSACVAGILAGRGARAVHLLALANAAFSSLIAVAGIVVASEARVPIARDMGLVAVAIGAMMLAGGTIASLRAAALAQDDGD